jgi:UDP-4-amino-4,6-dideoxy-N-acetyl-beta-L-altrosamine N-acetyltransferase
VSETPVALRSLTREDADMVLRWRNSPDVAGFSLSDRLIAPDEHAAFIERVLDEDDSRYWIIEVAGRPVGLVNVEDIDDEAGTCEWGFYVAEPTERGQGIGTRALDQALRWAFEVRGVREVRAVVLVTNLPGLAVHRRLGFAEEGIAYEQAQHAGGPVDLVRFSLTAEAWRARG